MEIIDLKEGETFAQDGIYEAYVIIGSLKSDTVTLNDGDLFSGSGLQLTAEETSRFILVFEEG